MRLIDADSFFKDIVKLCGCVPYVEGKHGETIYLNNLIDEQPTAYDVDKVAEQLEQLNKAEKSRAAEYDEIGKLDLMDIHDAKAEAYISSRRIVKSGALNEIGCGNTSCKHHQGKDMCNTTVKIGSNGKCESFEKGFLYYFHRVWDELGDSNYIDFVKINRDEDLRIGIFMVCKVYGISFSEVEWGLCRMLMFKESAKGNPLHCKDIVSREMNHEEYDKLFRDFQNGILPGVTHEKAKKGSQPFGWLSPMGEFTEGGFAEHEEVAERIIEKSGFGDEYEDWLMLNSEGVTCRDFLAEVKGYCLIHNPAGYGGYIVSNVKPLTKKQKEFLYEYFIDIGDKFKADQYMD